MVVSLKHKFTTAKTDGVDTTLVRPSNWNDEHDITLAASKLLGRATASTGAAEEITVGTSLSLDAATQTLRRAALTGDVTSPVDSNATTIAAGAATLAKLDRTGTSGQVLTAQGSGVAPVWATPTSSAGSSQQSTITSDLVLTTASPKVITVSSTNNADVQLPNATTYSQTGGELFKIYNIGYTILWIKDNGGRYLIGLEPGKEANISLVLNSSSNGLWAINDNLVNQTVSKAGRFTLLETDYSDIGPIAIGAISETSVVLAYADTNTTSTDPNFKWIVLGTKSSNVWTFGTPVVINSTVATTDIRLVVLSATTGLIAFNDNNVTAGSRATWVAPYSLSGSTLTVGTASNATSGATLRQNITTFALIGTDALLVTESGATVNTYRIIRHNGTTVTLGTQLLSGASSSAYGTVILSSTKFLSAYTSVANNNFIGLRYFTVSGTTITQGTEVTTTLAANDDGYSNNLIGVISTSTEVIFTSVNNVSDADLLLVVNTSNATTPSVTSAKSRGYIPIESAVLPYSTTKAIGLGGEKVTIVAGDGMYYSGKIPLIATSATDNNQNVNKRQISPLDSTVIFVASRVNEGIVFQAVYST